VFHEVILPKNKSREAKATGRARDVTERQSASTGSGRRKSRRAGEDTPKAPRPFADPEPRKPALDSAISQRQDVTNELQQNVINLGLARFCLRERLAGDPPCSAHKLRSNRMSIRRRSDLLQVLMARLHPYQRERARALKPEAQAERNCIF
jgi:hypothetical protein